MWRQVVLPPIWVDCGNYTNSSLRILQCAAICSQMFLHPFSYIYKIYQDIFSEPGTNDDILRIRFVFEKSRESGTALPYSKSFAADNSYPGGALQEEVYWTFCSWNFSKKIHNFLRKPLQDKNNKLSLVLICFEGRFLVEQQAFEDYTFIVLFTVFFTHKSFQRGRKCNGTYAYKIHVNFFACDVSGQNDDRCWTKFKYLTSVLIYLDNHSYFISKNLLDGDLALRLQENYFSYAYIQFFHVQKVNGKSVFLSVRRRWAKIGATPKFL